MVSYRRSRVPGACYFLTLALQDRRRDLLVRYCGDLRQSIRTAMIRKPFRLPAIVVLPDHLHLLIELPPGDADFSSRVRMLKSGFVSLLRKQSDVDLRFSAKGEANIWQRRFWEHLIRDERDYAAHVDYIHFNPVKHGLVGAVRDWPLSSFHRFVRQGLLPADWVGGAEPEVASAGE
ncbi:transposase [Pseudomonas sp. BN417]|uniref:REP-associated tyrosine transposase n=1 Tax=Pseudomonas sp. BN417 TaxID=2567890 RepID=UPI002453A6A4|nr:transposase [Pseudomonas sp. BN417]MDH4558566.1 transposase [Pseudomonas sp. BN417]